MRELKELDPKLSAYFITDRKFGHQTTELVDNSKLSIQVKIIVAGKLRRYHKLALLKQLLDVPTVLRNLSDMILVLVGFLQSLFFLIRIQPDVVFCKGGFVCLPIGLAAACLRIPLVVHDSDAHAGLTNRIISRFAAVIATGAPLENYSYPTEKTHFVGIPVDSSFKPVSIAGQRKYKDRLGLHDITRPLVVITGGSLGARNINQAITAIAPHLLGSCALLHITGSSNFEATVSAAPEHIDYLLKPFVSDGTAKIFGAADVVVTRAGMSTLYELAAMAKPVIIIPNPLLTGGHQLKNAAVYQKAHAAIVLDENEIVCDPSVLERAIMILIKDPRKRQFLGNNLHKFAKADAATDMAALIVEAMATHGGASEHGVD